MTTSPAPRDLAFVRLKHATQLADFQYVELVAVEGDQATVKVVGPDSEDDESGFSMPIETFSRRLVPAQERELWPGSFLAHPVAFVQTSADGVDEWAYGIVSGYTASPVETTLHLVCQHGPTRLALHSTTAVIKVNALNYALQTGSGVNAAGLSPMELLEEQNKLVASCQRHRSGPPKAVMTNVSVPYNGTEVVPLMNPASPHLGRV
ncbi:hypothetical protein V7S43_009841 [Phytophthora oleae]|uniref:Uncharacterized protein n=1 Tax=Phytophthora oleae TaxID=2107226 RepID=A0ABD3FEL7_9STRA